MDDNRLPKMILHGQLTPVATKKAKKHQGGQESSYKSAIKKDIETFGLLKRGCSYDRWIALQTLASNREAWRNAVKTDGIKLCLNAWYTMEAAKSNKRHEKEDGIHYIPKVAYSHRHPSEVAIKVVDLSGAILSGAVSVRRHRINKKAVTSPVLPHVPFALCMLKDLKSQEC
jgi:hypothetical protein